MPAERHAARRQKLLRKLREADADTLLVSNVKNVTYLTGFTGDSSWLLLGPRLALLISDPRYTTQIEEECRGLDIELRVPGQPIEEKTAEVLGRLGLNRVAFESTTMTVAQYDALRAKTAGVELVPAAGLVEELREVKDAGEIEEIRTAIHLAERGFTALRALWVGEMTEQQAAHELEHAMRRFGAQGVSFEPIIAVGDRAALPHYRPSGHRLGEGEFVLVDWGATGAGGYKSDLTRLVATSKIRPKLEKVYAVVFNARQQAIKAIRPGARGADVDAVARTVIEQAGYGKQFGHSLGHGIGLDIHEGPRLAPGSDSVLQPGMVVTVEPGIYLPGWGGVRIEDDVLVTRDGCDVLSSVSTELADAMI